MGGEPVENPLQQGVASFAPLNTPQTVGDVIPLYKLDLQMCCAPFVSGAAGGAQQAVDHQVAAYLRVSRQLHVALQVQIPCQVHIALNI